jgi:hypothetical protein
MSSACASTAIDSWVDAMTPQEPSEKLTLEGTDISHARLVELARLADQAKPFYE